MEFGRFERDGEAPRVGGVDRGRVAHIQRKDFHEDRIGLRADRDQPPQDELKMEWVRAVNRRVENQRRVLIAGNDFGKPIRGECSFRPGRAQHGDHRPVRVFALALLQMADRGPVLRIGPVEASAVDPDVQIRLQPRNRENPHEQGPPTAAHALHVDSEPDRSYRFKLNRLFPARDLKGEHDFPRGDRARITEDPRRWRKSRAGG